MSQQEKEIELRKIRSRIDWMCKDKIAAFSPTISPAPKSESRGEIESIFEGVKYYVDRGVKDLVIQRKYMGSYCDIYLHKDIDETYFVSRSGYKIDYINLTEAKLACERLYEKFDWSNMAMIIIQAELLPWHALGSRLIEREFEGYLQAHQQRLDYFKSSDLLTKIERIKSKVLFTEYISDKSALTGSLLKKKYAAHVIRQNEALTLFEAPELHSYGSGITVFENQISHFGKEGPLHFKPFNILKLIYSDGQEKMPDDNLTYGIVNDDEQLVLHVEEMAELEEKVTPVYEWYHSLTLEMEEGIVIKPRTAFIKGIAPALKVRNNDYLTMIYGVNFQEDMERQIRKRKTANKMACSINDWEINFALLQVPYNEIQADNYYYRNLMLDRILQEEREVNLDPSL